MDAQHDLVGLQAWMVLIQYSVYEIYQYMQMEHYFFFIIQETVYFVFLQKYPKYPEYPSTTLTNDVRNVWRRVNVVISP